VGPHFPSPLGRLLRLPAVPVAALGSAPFSVLHQEDAARAVVAALAADVEGALNVVAPGAVTAVQAARLGGRAVVPIFGPGWRAARLAAEAAGAPLPEHVRELLIRGRTADGGRAAEVLAAPARTTLEVVEHLFDWPAVTHLAPMEEVA
jgi:UDP-glucose 4-epimerase